MGDVRDEKRGNMPPVFQQNGDRGHLTNYSEIYFMSKYHIFKIPKKKQQQQSTASTDVRVRLCRDVLITVVLLSLVILLATFPWQITCTCLVQRGCNHPRC